MNKAEKLLRRMSEALDDFGPDEDIGIFGSGMWRPLATVEEIRKATTATPASAAIRRTECKCGEELVYINGVATCGICDFAEVGEREYDPAVAPCDDAEFGMKP